MKMKEVFTALDDNEKEIELAVRRPTTKELQRASLEYSKAYSEALDNKLMVAARVDSYMKDQNIWNSQKEQEKTELENSIREGQKILAAGGISKNKGREIAI